MSVCVRAIPQLFSTKLFVCSVFVCVPNCPPLNISPTSPPPPNGTIGRTAEFRPIPKYCALQDQDALPSNTHFDSCNTIDQVHYFWVLILLMHQDTGKTLANTKQYKICYTNIAPTAAMQRYIGRFTGTEVLYTFLKEIKKAMKDQKIPVDR